MMSIPHAVTRLLSSAITRVRRIYLLRGIAAVGIVWILGVAAVMSVDAYFVIFDDRIRCAMTAAVALLVLFMVASAIVVPLGRRLDFRKMAKAIDARHPEMEERFSTLVELSDSDVAKAGFSASLFALVCKLAEEDVAKIDLTREFPLFGALRRLAAFLLLLLAMGVGLVASPNRVGLLFVRAVAPWVDVGNLFSSEIAVKPGDHVALAGAVIRIEAFPTSQTSRPSRPYTIRLSRRTSAGWSPETTEPMSNGVYETTADLNEREWRYRVNIGPAVTRYYHVRVSELPKYDSLTARVDYPDYTGFAPTVCSNGAVSAIRAIAGSRVTFDLKVSEPGTVSDFLIDGQRVFEHTMVSNRTSEWSLELVNREGFMSLIGRHPLTSYIDQPPSVVIESPASNRLKLPPHAKLRIELTASDDVSVVRPNIRYSIDGAEMAVLREVDEFSCSVGNLWHGKAEIDLSRLDLSRARNVRFDLVAHDTCPEEYGGPHVVTSSVINVELEVQEWGLAVADLHQQAKESEALIDEAKKRLKDAEHLARQLRDEYKREGEVSEATERKNETAAHEASEAEHRLDELRERLEDDERFAPLVEPLEKAVDELIHPALEKIENAQFRNREERAEELVKAADELKRAHAKMDELAKKLKERTEEVDAFEKVKDLADRQEALARSAQELLEERPADLSKLEAWKRLEEEAMRRAEELARSRPDSDLAEARRKMETAARKIDELKRSAEDSARRQEAYQANELREAAASQARALKAMKQAAFHRNEERHHLESNNRYAADANARTSERLEAQASEAQRSAEDRLERGEATAEVKALQKKASAMMSLAREDPRSQEKANAAVEAQQAAAEALGREQAIRKTVPKQSDPPAEAALSAANAAAAAMEREVKSQSTKLGISAQSGESKGQKDPDLGSVDNANLFSPLGWFKVRGVSKEVLRQRDLSDVPNEYRDLVRRYFLKLAEENPQ